MIPAGYVWGYKAGASGTLTAGTEIPKGALIEQIVVHSTAGGTVTIGGGNSLPIIANAASTHLRFALAPLRNATAIVFTGTDSYFVSYYAQAGQ
jgi:hypothetical protein